MSKKLGSRIVSSEISAMKKCVKLWDKIANFMEENTDGDIDGYKHLNINGISGIHDIYDIKGMVSKQLKFAKMRHDCPCCEFSHSSDISDIEYEACESCYYCPMKDFWIPNRKENLSYTLNSRGFWCEWRDSPYSPLMKIETLETCYAEEVTGLTIQCLEYWEGMRDMNLTY